MSWFNKNKIVVDTKYNRKHGNKWTLIKNTTGERADYCFTFQLLDGLIANDSGAKDEINRMVREELETKMVELDMINEEQKQNEKLSKHFTFFLHKDVAPLIINKMDAMECVGHWSIDKTELFNDMLVVKYDASRQVLFQTENGVIVKED